jgi:uncharacterized membrane protein (DUF373 family)
VDEGREHWLRERTEGFFGYIEDGFYVAVAAALSVAGLILFAYTVYDFAVHMTEGDFTQKVLGLLDGLLLVFIITELIHTVRAVIDEKVLVAEPFLIVGIVAAIRRLVVVSAEAKSLLGTEDFADAMLEMGILTASALVLALAIFLMRKTSTSEPTSEHEPD